MAETPCSNKDVVVLERRHFQTLLDALSNMGHELLGPTVRDQAIVYTKINTVGNLPIGSVDEHEPGRYRLKKGKKKTLFGYAVSSDSWKRFLYPPHEVLFEARREGNSFGVDPAEADQIKRALIGVRACELAALKIHDKVLIQGRYGDHAYHRRRQNLFIVAVNCANPGNTCFCASMETGPRVTSGFDLALTEVCTSGRHYFLVEIGSPAGRKLTCSLPVRRAKTAEMAAAQKVLNRAAAKMGRTLKTEGLSESLYGKFDDPYWETIADRCLSCGNCTMVCPTCFCTNIDDTTDLTGQQAQRQRRWDSCFTMDHSYIHGGSIRNSAASRYRQWLMHKLAYWQDQFDTPGCVGCGRCITWCPVGIDITQEASELIAT